MYTDWFCTNTGVRQGDVISPTLFSIFINDLAIDFKTLDKGILCGNNKLSILLYADDIVPSCRKREVFARHAKLYPKVVSEMEAKINESKSNVVHFRTPKQRRNNCVFKYG